jgi:hypothetical protein
MTKNGTPEMRYAHPWLADVGVDVVGVGALAERGEGHLPVQADVGGEVGEVLVMADVAPSTK